MFQNPAASPLLAEEMPRILIGKPDQIDSTLLFSKVLYCASPMRSIGDAQVCAHMCAHLGEKISHKWEIFSPLRAQKWGAPTKCRAQAPFGGSPPVKELLNLQGPTPK